jgi:hypothetical protein
MSKPHFVKLGDLYVNVAQVTHIVRGPVKDDAPDGLTFHFASREKKSIFIGMQYEGDVDRLIVGHDNIVEKKRG